jgi:hypothetical protein
MWRGVGPSNQPVRKELMFRIGENVESNLLGELRQLDHLIEHELDFVRPMRDRTKSFVFGRGSWHNGTKMENEFHDVPSFVIRP